MKANKELYDQERDSQINFDYLQNLLSEQDETQKDEITAFFVMDALTDGEHSKKYVEKFLIEESEI